MRSALVLQGKQASQFQFFVKGISKNYQFNKE